MGHKPARKWKRFLLYLAGGLMGGLLLGACTIGRPPIGNQAPPLSDTGRHLLEGDVLLLKGEYEAARREACLQLERFPGQADDRAFYLLGMVWVHPDNPRRDIHRADVCFRRIEDRYPDSPLVVAANRDELLAREATSMTVEEMEIDPIIAKAMNVLLILHADHATIRRMWRTFRSRKLSFSTSVDSSS